MVSKRSTRKTLKRKSLKKSSKKGGASKKRSSKKNSKRSSRRVNRGGASPPSPRSPAVGVPAVGVPVSPQNLSTGYPVTRNIPQPSLEEPEELKLESLKNKEIKVLLFDDINIKLSKIIN